MEQKFFQVLASIGVCFLLAACSSGPEVPEFRTEGMTLAPKKATSRPYQIKGSWYYPQPHYEYVEEGIASYYGGGDIFHGRPTATGERFDMNGITAAHKTLPLPCIAKVTNLENGRELIVKVNDRGPFPPGRLIDVSRRSAQLLGFEGKGLAKVRVETLVPESLALNGIDSSTVMMAQAPRELVTVQVPPPSEPDTLVEALSGTQPSPEAVPILASTAVVPVRLAESAPFPRASVVPGDALPVSVTEAPQPISIAETAPCALSFENQPSQVPIKLGSPVETGIFVYVGECETQAKAKSLIGSLEGFIDAPLTIMKNRGPKPYAAGFGPLPSMSYANEVLDQLINAGHHISRIVIQR